jgi:hypothetical protein
MNEAIVIASEQVENQAKEMNENNLAMEQMPSSEDKPSPFVMFYSSIIPSLHISL